MNTSSNVALTNWPVCSRLANRLRQSSSFVSQLILIPDVLFNAISHRKMRNKPHRLLACCIPWEFLSTKMLPLVELSKSTNSQHGYVCQSSITPMKAKRVSLVSFPHSNVNSRSEAGLD